MIALHTCVYYLGCRVAAKALSLDDVAAKAKSFLREFASVGDINEALLCVKELQEAPKEEGVPANLAGRRC